jgi:hypothetical protein
MDGYVACIAGHSRIICGQILLGMPERSLEYIIMAGNK